MLRKLGRWLLKEEPVSPPGDRSISPDIGGIAQEADASTVHVKIETGLNDFACPQEQEKYLQVDSTEPGGTHSEQAATGTRLGAELSAVKGEGLVAGLDEGLDEGLDTGLGAGLAVVPAGRTMGPWRPVMPC